MGSGSTCLSPAWGAAPDSPPKNSLAEPSPHQHKGPGSSWGQARVTQPPHGHQKGWTGFPRAPAASGFLLCFAAAAITSSLSSSALSPTQSDILHSAAVPSATTVPWPGGPLSPSQLGQKGNRTSVTAAWGRLRPPLYGFQPCHCPCQHDKTSSRRWHLRAELSQGTGLEGSTSPSAPRVCLQAIPCSLLFFQPPAEDGKTPRIHFSSSRSCLGPWAPSRAGFRSPGLEKAAGPAAAAHGPAPSPNLGVWMEKQRS